MAEHALELWWSLLRARWAPWAGGRRLQRALHGAPSHGVDDVERARALAARVAAVARAVPRSRCLDRALVLTERLHAAGCNAGLRLGVRREAGRLRAHAWVEVAGQAIGEDPQLLRELAPLSTAPARGLGFD